nr:NAD(P)-binding domain-containing protein [uncultured Oscillibacter sp.]
MRIFDAQQVEQLLTMRDAIEAVRTAFGLQSSGACQTPLRTVLQTPEGDGKFLFMPSYCPELGYVACKNINLFDGNRAAGLPTSFAQILLINGHNGRCEAVLDGDAVTRLRTAGATGAALSALANPNCRKAALFGTGSQAGAQLEAIITACGPEEVAVCGRDPEKTRRFVCRLQDRWPVRLTAVETGAEAVRDADVIVTATSSGEALFPAEAVKSGCTISAIGNYSPDRTELPPELFSRVDRVYVDDVAAAKAEAGDLLLPLSQGYLRSEQIAGELGQLFLGQIPGRTSAEEILVFKSVGIGIQDLVTSLRVYEAARTVPAGR